MKKLLLLTKTLLAAALLCVGQNAWGETITKTIYSWTFTGNASDETVTLDAETTLTENSTSCKLATAPANCAGLYFQKGDDDKDKNGWKCYKTTTGLRNLCGGNRMCIVPGLSAGDVITISCNNTDYIKASKYTGTPNGGKTLMTYTMSADGNFWFSLQKTGGSPAEYPSLYSIKVTREVEAVIVKSWDLTKCTWAKGTGFGTSTVTINGQSCTYATGDLEGLALQGGSGTEWVVNGSGLRESNGTRNIAILDLKAGDAVTVVSNTSAISSLVNGTSVNDTYSGTCKFSVTNDGAFGFKVERYISGEDVLAYTSSIVVYRALSEVVTEYNEVKDIAEALRDVPNDNSAANSTLSSAITTQNAAVASATTYAQISTAKTALLNAVMTYIAAANPTTGNQFDLTFLLTNPDLEGIEDWGDAAAQGWFTDIPRTDLGEYNNFAARTNQSKNCVERYTSDVCTTANTFGLYQKVTLPAGNYRFGAYALADNVSNIVMAAGNAEGDAVTAGTLTAYTVDFTQASNSEIKMGLKISAEGTNAARWMAIADLKLYKEAPTSVSATIGSTGWTTFASPYALNLSSMTASTGEVTAYYASETSAESVTVLPTSSSAVQAGEGILLKGTANATITIPVVASGSAIDGNLMVGCPTGATITNETENYGNCYVLGIESEKAVFQNVKDYIDGSNTVNIPAGKAYLNATASYGARSMRISFGDITGVANVEAAAEAKAKDGKFIENGKLVIVKNGVKYNAAGAQVK